jgi:hypothetical protein
LTEPGSGLPPHAQSAIVGRFLGFQALAPTISLIESNGYHDVADSLRQRLCVLTNEVLDRPGAVQEVEHFLFNLVEELGSEAARLRDGTVVAGQALKVLGNLVASFRTAPYDPLGQLADGVVRTASDYYREYGADVPNDLWRSAINQFSFVGGKIGLSFVNSIHVQIWTEFGTRDNPSAAVVVKISPRFLDQETIAALPRLFLHEYIAHVPQGPYSTRRIHPDPCDSFAEGWMDYVAHCIFRAVLESRARSDGLERILIPNWKLLYEEASEHFFRARCAVVDGDRTAATRREGVLAALYLHDLLRQLTVTSAEADKFLYRLSFWLNASRRDNAARSIFAAKVRLCGAVASRADELTDPLREWISGVLSSDDLFERIVED